jgi:cytochrome c oxidase accessory protein FixG
MKDPREVPLDSLASLDEFGDRNYLFPAEVRGHFKKWRNIIHPLFIAFFLILPWIKVDGQQWVLLNLPERKFNIFGLSFWAHDTPMIFFVISGALVGLSFITAVWGRIWCGWACPQTVFIEGIFRRIEALVEGNHIERKRLSQAPLSFGKFTKSSIKWSLFLAVSLIITHSFLAYFVGSDRLLEMIQHNPKENWTPFIIICITTGIILFDFGWFREQFCLIMCPYGRFQSVLMDKNSMAVLYDNKRGEPRKTKDNKDASNLGDCINCFKCVNVCPTGIDIRNGLQMECIACTACIDACDEVMEKIKKPKGLIRYASETSIEGGKTKNVRPRTILYGTILIILFSAFSFFLSKKQAVNFSIIRAVEEPFKIVDLGEGKKEIINHFKVHIQNQGNDRVSTQYELFGDNAVNFTLISPENPSVTEGGKKKWVHFFIKVDVETYKNLPLKDVEITFKTKGDKTDLTDNQSIKILGP